MQNCQFDHKESNKLILILLTQKNIIFDRNLEGKKKIQVTELYYLLAEFNNNTTSWYTLRKDSHNHFLWFLIKLMPVHIQHGIDTISRKKKTSLIHNCDKSIKNNVNSTYASLLIMLKI